MKRHARRGRVAQKTQINHLLYLRNHCDYSINRRIYCVSQCISFAAVSPVHHHLDGRSHAVASPSHVTVASAWASSGGEPRVPWPGSGPHGYEQNGKPKHELAANSMFGVITAKDFRDTGLPPERQAGERGDVRPGEAAQAALLGE